MESLLKNGEVMGVITRMQGAVQEFCEAHKEARFSRSSFVVVGLKDGGTILQMYLRVMPRFKGPEGQREQVRYLELASVDVHEDYQHHGILNAALQALMAQADARGWGFRVENVLDEAHHGIYLRRGMQRQHEDPSHWGYLCFVRPPR